MVHAIPLSRFGAMLAKAAAVAVGAAALAYHPPLAPSIGAAQWQRLGIVLVAAAPIDRPRRLGRRVRLG